MAAASAMSATSGTEVTDAQRRYWAHYTDAFIEIYEGKPFVNLQFKWLDSSKESICGRFLSGMLRHDHGANRGVVRDAEGWIDLVALLEGGLARKARDANYLYNIVECNKNRRFRCKRDLETNRVWLQAEQGHSGAEVEGLLTDITLDNYQSLDVGPVIVHGTTKENWPLIRASGGLSRVNRTHIHFCRYDLDRGDEVISGMRSSSEFAIRIRLPDLLHAGFRVQFSQNGVVMVRQDIPMSMFLNVVSLGPGAPKIVWFPTVHAKLQSAPWNQSATLAAPAVAAPEPGRLPQFPPAQLGGSSSSAGAARSFSQFVPVKACPGSAPAKAPPSAVSIAAVPPAAAVLMKSPPPATSASAATSRPSAPPVKMPPQQPVSSAKTSVTACSDSQNSCFVDDVAGAALLGCSAGSTCDCAIYDFVATPELSPGRSRVIYFTLCSVQGLGRRC